MGKESRRKRSLREHYCGSFRTQDHSTLPQLKHEGAVIYGSRGPIIERRNVCGVYESQDDKFYCWYMQNYKVYGPFADLETVCRFATEFFKVKQFSPFESPFGNWMTDDEDGLLDELVAEYEATH